MRNSLSSLKLTSVLAQNSKQFLVCHTSKKATLLLRSPPSCRHLSSFAGCESPPSLLLILFYCFWTAAHVNCLCGPDFAGRGMLKAASVDDGNVLLKGLLAGTMGVIGAAWCYSAFGDPVQASETAAVVPSHSIDNDQQLQSASVDRQSASSLNQTIAEAREVMLRYKEEAGFPGATITVMVNGRIVWSEGAASSSLLLISTTRHRHRWLM